MSWFRRLLGILPRRKGVPVAPALEILESRALLADGITAAAGPALTVVAGVPFNSAVFATYVVSDPSGGPGDQWRALINFGDGHSEGPLIPVENGSVFEFVDSHTYATPGIYDVTVMIAVPGSQKPNDNTVTMRVTVNSPTGSTNPNPPPSQNTVLRAFGGSLKAKEKKAFSGEVARFTETGAKGHGFTALINWGDQSTPTAGRIRSVGNGRFQVFASHRYSSPGLFHVTIEIEDAKGDSAGAITTIHVRK